MVLHTVKYKLKNVQYTKKGPKDFGISFNSEEKNTVFYVEPTVHEHKCGASGTLRTPISGTNTGETIEKVKWPKHSRTVIKYAYLLAVERLCQAFTVVDSALSKKLKQTN